MALTGDDPNAWWNPYSNQYEDKSTMPQAFDTNAQGQVWDPRMKKWSNDTVDFLKQREAQFVANPEAPATWTRAEGWAGGAAPIPDFSAMSYNTGTGSWSGAQPQAAPAPQRQQMPQLPQSNPFSQFGFGNQPLGLGGGNPFGSGLMGYGFGSRGMPFGGYGMSQMNPFFSSYWNQQPRQNSFGMPSFGGYGQGYGGYGQGFGGGFMNQYGNPFSFGMYR